ncbi:MAG: peptidoglycan/LPS O-acetylase OafA/YrhL [Crocinitomicaceae bacterium]|jgi:peptidoglycan/LPS O-acetylase OafA/YrhL
MIYFRRLDSLRFIAFFLVFWAHLFNTFNFDAITDSANLKTFFHALVNTGGMGVHLFFVLSGFLITYLLIREHKTNGKIHVGKFYIRRILRIWPLYYLVFLSGIFILPYLFNSFYFDGSIAKNLLMLNNFDVLESSNRINMVIGWSVAIEEQFYVFWPICFLLLFKRKLLLLFCCIACILSMFFIVFSEGITYFHTFANINYLMIGCIGAILYTNYKDYISSRLMNRSLFVANIVIIVIVLIVIGMYPSIHLIALVLPVNYLLLILYLVDAESGGKPSLISRLGKYTYGMYMYHAIFLILTRIIFDKLQLYYELDILLLTLVGIISLSITILVSVLSYKYFEKPFLLLKNKFTIVKTRT